MPARLVILVAVALSLGALTGWVDVRSKAVQLPFLMLVVFCGSLGLLQPQRGWLWALIVGGGIVIANWIADVIGYRRPAPGNGPVVLVLVPALAAAYLGAGVGWLLRRVARMV